MILYKYLLIYTKKNELIYGECIEWKCGAYDKKDSLKINIPLKQGLRASVIYENNRIEEISEKTIKFNQDLIFEYNQKETDFVTQRFDEFIFTPLIDRCSEIDVFIDEVESIKQKEWIDKNQSVIEQIKNDFGVDLHKHPELYKTFTFYKPTRINVITKYPKKNTNSQSVRYKFVDEFLEYQDYSYKITLYESDNVIQNITGHISDDIKELAIDIQPDAEEIKIFKENHVIYDSMNYFIKKININGILVSDSVILENGDKINKNLNFNVMVSDDDVKSER